MAASEDEITEVLLVDDKPENLLSLETVLEAPDLRFIRALSGEQALEAMLNSKPALVLLDVQMPGMSGFEVARYLRGFERTRDIPIIFVTATHREERFSFEGFESGAVDYLLKPLNPVIVRSKVRIFVELHRKSLRLERAVRDLSLVNQELESFSYSVSHDLRAPVRSIVGFGGQLLEGATDPAVRGDLERIVRAGERMNHLIDGLLELARISRFEPILKDVNLSSLAEEICADLRKENPSREVDVTIGDGLHAQGDRRLLDAMMRNLLSNAFKFTAKTETPKVEVGMENREGENVYYVRDNGAGFDMASSPRLFGAFQRLHSDADFAGTGVGLATVRRIVHRHNGRIWAESAPGAGATFYFVLT